MVAHFNSGESQNNDWDVVILAGQELPGYAKVDVVLPTGLDVQKARGAKGATIRDTGDNPAKVKIRTALEDREELDALQAMVPLLRPRGKTSARDPLTIVHPNANFWGITAICIEEVSSPHPTALGGWEIVIDAIEWLPPAKVKSQAKSPTDTAQAQYMNLSPRDGILVEGLGPSEAERSPSKTDAALKNLQVEIDKLLDRYDPSISYLDREVHHGGNPT